MLKNAQAIKKKIKWNYEYMPDKKLGVRHNFTELSVFFLKA